MQAASPNFTDTVFPPDHPWRRGETIRLTLPSLYMPWSASTAPLAKEAETQALAWAARHGLCDTEETRSQAAALQIGDFCSRICRETRWSEPFQLMVDSVYFGFFIDDVIDGALGPDTSARSLADILTIGHAFLHVLKDPTSHLVAELGCLGPAVRDLGERIHRIGNYPYLTRYIRDLREYLTASYWQNANLASGRRLADLSTIVEQTTDISGHGTFTALFPYLTPQPLPVEILDSQQMRALVDLMATVCELENHMVSTGRDLWLSEHHPNHEDATGFGVAQLARTTGIPLDLALHQMADLTNALTGQFTRMYTQMSATADPDTAYYLRTVAQTIRGNFDWSLTTPRYTNPDGRHPDAITITATTHGTCPADDGPPVPAAARWWQT
ncbi:hypothetical protein ABZ746_23570 [Streptomyces sp. NPDC020096]